MRSGTLTAILLAVLTAAPARADLFTAGGFSAYGDFRLRLETDRDSQDAVGLPREDRTRLRARVRAGAHFEPSEHWRFEARLRSGAEASQQSPHVTLVDFDNQDTGDTSFDFDRWFLRGRVGDFYAWVGRNNLPFWKQDELVTDDDVTMEGLALGFTRDVGPGALSVTGGYFSPPAGMRASTGNLAAAQVVYRPQIGLVRWTFALGSRRHDANPDDPDAGLLLENNGFRDYELLEASMQAQFTVGEELLVLGGDVMHNSEDYSADDPDPITAANSDQTDGYALLVTYGALGQRNEWLAGYSYARIEAFAVNNSYAQDDWVRWGSATQTRASNMEGHELRFGWAFGPKTSVLARLFLAESITTVEDGKRLRIDFNYTF